MGHPAAPFAAELQAAPLDRAVDARAFVDPRAHLAADCVIRSGAHISAGVALGRFAGALSASTGAATWSVAPT